MNKLFISTALLLTSVPASAAPAFNIPEPSLLPLMGLGFIAFSLVRRFKK